MGGVEVGRYHDEVMRGRRTRRRKRGAAAGEALCQKRDGRGGAAILRSKEMEE